MATITIETEELGHLTACILGFRSQDADRPALEGVQVTPTEAGLRWLTTDSYRLGYVHAGQSDLQQSIVIPADLIDFALRYARRCELDTVTLEVDDQHEVIELQTPELLVPRQLIALDYPDVEPFTSGAPEQTPTLLTLNGETLRAAIHATITFNDSTEDKGGHPVALRTVNDDTLMILARWPDIADTHAYVQATSDGPIDTILNSSYLQELLDAAGDNQLRLHIGSSTEPLRARSDNGFHGLLMPIHGGQPNLERRIAAYLNLDRSELVINDNDWIPIGRGETSIGVRLVTSNDPFGRGNIARFTTQIAENLPETPGLLAELNALNNNAQLCRVVHQDDKVHVVAEGLLDTLDDEEIDTICRQLHHHAQTFGPLIQTVWA